MERAVPVSPLMVPFALYCAHAPGSKARKTITMNKWILSACILVLAAAPVAAVDVRLDSYRNPKSDGLRNAYRVFLDGAKSGFMAYNAWMKSHGGQPAFCLPENLAMPVEQAEDIMLWRADKTSAKGEMLVSILLLNGLRDTFPCEKSDSR